MSPDSSVLPAFDQEGFIGAKWYMALSYLTSRGLALYIAAPVPILRVRSVGIRKSQKPPFSRQHYHRRMVLRHHVARHETRRLVWMTRAGKANRLEPLSVSCDDREGNMGFSFLGIRVCGCRSGMPPHTALFEQSHIHMLALQSQKETLGNR